MGSRFDIPLEDSTDDLLSTFTYNESLTDIQDHTMWYETTSMDLLTNQTPPSLELKVLIGSIDPYTSAAPGFMISDFILMVIIAISFSKYK